MKPFVRSRVRRAAWFLRGEKAAERGREKMAPSWRFNVPSVILWEIQVTTNGFLWGRAVISCFRGAGGLSSQSLLTVPKKQKNPDSSDSPAVFLSMDAVWCLEVTSISCLFIYLTRKILISPLSVWY